MNRSREDHMREDRGTGADHITIFNRLIFLKNCRNRAVNTTSLRREFPLSIGQKCAQTVTHFFKQIDLLFAFP